MADNFVAEFVDSSLEQMEEMHSEILRIAEGTCNCSIEIKSLQEELAVCHSEINGLSLQLKEASKPFGSEETLDSDERDFLISRACQT